MFLWWGFRFVGAVASGIGFIVAIAKLPANLATMYSWLGPLSVDWVRVVLGLACLVVLGLIYGSQIKRWKLKSPTGQETSKAARRGVASQAGWRALAELALAVVVALAAFWGLRVYASEYLALHFLVDCHGIEIPKTHPLEGVVWVLRSPQVPMSDFLIELRGDPGEDLKLPLYNKPSAQTIPPAIQCSVTNYGDRAVIDVSLPTFIKFSQAVADPQNKGQWMRGAAFGGNAGLRFPRIDPGSGSFVFYLLNLSPQFVDVYFSGAMELRIVGRPSLEPVQSSSIQFTWNPVYISPPFSALPKN